MKYNPIALISILFAFGLTGGDALLIPVDDHYYHRERVLIVPEQQCYPPPVRERVIFVPPFRYVPVMPRPMSFPRYNDGHRRHGRYGRY